MLSRRHLKLDMRERTEVGVPIRKLFIGNLAPRTTHKDLMDLFQKFGKIENCYVRRVDRKTNYAFIQFREASEATIARLNMAQGSLLHNRLLRVMPADSWHQPDSVENQYMGSQQYQPILLEDKKSSDPDDSNTVARISILNNDCLLHIFNYLPIADRVRIARVCSHWKALTEESWCTFKKLDLEPRSWGKYGNRFEPGTMNTTILRTVLLKCGIFLTEINLSQITCSLSQSTLTIIGQFCPNLQNINVVGLTVSPGGINSLVRNCHDIIKLTLGRSMYCCDMDLKKLFNVNKKLQSFRVIHGNVTGECLQYLPLDTIEEIVFEEPRSLVGLYLTQAIEKFEKLKRLSITRANITSDGLFAAIGTYCTNLRELELYAVEVGTRNTMTHITKLVNLEVLKAARNVFVHDEILFAIAPNCTQLTYVDISGCTSVTNAGVEAIATLPKLETLKISYLTWLRDCCLQYMPNLKQLECRDCSLLSDDGICNLECCPQLELLDLSGCESITNATLENATEATRSRTNNTLLRLYTGGTQIDPPKFRKVSAYLQIISVDLSLSDERNASGMVVGYHDPDSDTYDETDTDSDMYDSDAYEYIDFVYPIFRRNAYDDF